ncbi:MAG: hypothetical protein KKG99_02150 [Bacteroidetes bacterium]|nr:hypothetical protein [Bacteroidota bacterium]
MKAIIKKIVFGIIGAIILFVVVVIVNLIVLEKNASIVSKGKPIVNYNEYNRALLVIDIQEATTGEISTDFYYKLNSDDLIESINQLAEYFNAQNNLVVYIRS